MAANVNKIQYVLNCTKLQINFTFFLKWFYFSGTDLKYSPCFTAANAKQGILCHTFTVPCSSFFLDFS